MPKNRMRPPSTRTGTTSPCCASHTWRTAANSAAYLLGSAATPTCGSWTSAADRAPSPPTWRNWYRTAMSPAWTGRRRSWSGPGPRPPARGLGNTDFAVADVHALDYPDDTFCVVHAHQVLQHVGDPVRALPRDASGSPNRHGIIAVRDSDYAAMTWYPASPGMDDWLNLYRRGGPRPTGASRTPGAG